MNLPPHRSLFALMFYAGATAVVAQGILVRELMVSFYGTEFALAAALSCWLLFVPLGSLTAGGLLRLVPNGLALFCAAALCLGLALPVQFFVARLVRPLLGVTMAGEFVSLRGILIAGAVAAAPVSFLVGMLFPAACHLEAAAKGDGARAIGRVYLAEALGSCGAGALMSLLLLPYQAPTSIALLTGALWLAACGLWLGGGRLGMLAPGLLWALVCPWGRLGAVGFAVLLGLLSCWGLAKIARPGSRSRGRRCGAGLSLGLALLLALVLMASGDQLRRRSLAGRWRTFDEFELIASRESRYQHLDVGYRDGEYVVRLHGMRATTFPDEHETRSSAALLLTQHPEPRTILIVGGGLGGLCQRVLEAGDFVVDYVEMDPAVISLCREHLPAALRAPLMADRFAAYACDGRYFIQNVLTSPQRVSRHAVPFAGAPRRGPAAPYDLVLVNLGDPTSVSANRFYTVECFQEIRRISAPGGVAAVWGITGNADYLHGPALSYTACIYRTLLEVFPGVVVRPGSEFRFFAGSDEGPTSDCELLARRFRQLGLEPAPMAAMFEESEFPPERVDYVRRELGSVRARTPADTDDRPVAYTRFLALQDHYSRRTRSEDGAAPDRVAKGFFGFVLDARPGWLVLPFAGCLLIVLLLRLILRPRRAATWACGFAIVTTGMFGLAAEMLIIYGYQTHFGYVYRDISLVVGLFMLGLAGGAWLSRRADERSAARTLVALEALQVLVLLVLADLMSLLSGSPYLFIVLSPLAGALTGAEFPLAARLGVGAGYRAGTVASLYDAADHAGAVIGAALTGLVLMPAFGLATSAALLACIKCASLLGLSAGPIVSMPGSARTAAGAR